MRPGQRHLRGDRTGAAAGISARWSRRRRGPVRPAAQPGQPCCPVNRCTGGCCVRAGITDGGSCVAEGATCSAEGGVCRGGACGACGGAGQPCCAGACTSARRPAGSSPVTESGACRAETAESPAAPTPCRSACSPRRRRPAWPATSPAAAASARRSDDGDRSPSPTPRRPAAVPARRPSGGWRVAWRSRWGWPAAGADRIPAIGSSRRGWRGSWITGRRGWRSRWPSRSATALRRRWTWGRCVSVPRGPGVGATAVAKRPLDLVATRCCSWIRARARAKTRRCGRPCGRWPRGGRRASGWLCFAGAAEATQVVPFLADRAALEERLAGGLAPSASPIAPAADAMAVAGAALSG